MDTGNGNPLTALPAGPYEVTVFGGGGASIDATGAPGFAHCPPASEGGDLARRRAEGIVAALEAAALVPGLRAEVERLAAELAASETERKALAERLAIVDGRTPTLLGPTVARRDPSGKGWSLMNNKSKGWSSFSYEFKSLEEMQRAFRVRLGAHGRDEHSEYVEVIPLSPVQP